MPDSRPPSITLYDAASLLKEKTLSPFVGKTRLLLNYKKIPFKTVWITFPEIEPTCKSVGAPPTRKKQDGSPHYTIPFITVTPPEGSEDPALAISDSGKIAEYIERAFPDPANTLIPEGTRVYRALLGQFMGEKLNLTMFPLIVDNYRDLLTTKEWYASTRETLLGSPIEAIVPKDEAGVVAAREKLWVGFDALANALDAEGEGNYHFVRGQVTYADMEVAALLYFISRISSERIWAHLKDRNGGRWQKLLDEFKPYLPVL